MPKPSENPPRYPEWTGSEPCRSTDPDAFFPEPGRIYVPEGLIKMICQECPSRVACGEWGIWHEREGWWGGLSPRERRDIRRRRNITMSAPEARMIIN